MTANVDAMIRAGVEAYKKGNKPEARALLEKAIEIDDHNELAWLWLSAVVTTQEDQRVCLENVLVINPGNERARQGLISLGVDPETIAPSPSAQGESSPAFVDDYQVPSSSASMGYAEEEPSGEDYDSWVDNLGIGSSSSEPAATSAQPFTEGDYSSEDDFFDDSLFNDPAPASSGTPAFEFGDDDLDSDFGSAPLTATSSNNDDDFLNVDALFAEDDAAAVVGDSIDDDLATFVDSEVLSPEPQRRPAPMPDDGDVFALFDRIPAEIEATRLPGSREGATAMSYVMLVLLLVLNAGAIGLLVMQFR